MIENEEYVKHPYSCAYCSRVYHWSADDLAWAYEASLHMPCGHPWQYRRAVEEDTRIFQVSIRQPDNDEIGQYTLSQLQEQYPELYPIVKSPSFVHLRITDETNRIEVSVLSQRTSKSPSERAQAS